MTNPAQYPGAPAPAPRSGPGFTLTLADVIIAAAGLLFFVFSFAGQYSVSVSGFGGGSASGGSSWDDATHVFTVLAALLAAGTAIAEKWWPRGKELLGFRRGQILVGLTLFVFVDMLSFLFGGGIGGFGVDVSLGWGGWLQLLLSAAAAAAAIMSHLGMLQTPIAMPKAAGPAGYQPPVGYQPPAGYQAPPAGYQQPGQYAPPPGQTMPAGPYNQPGGQPPSDTIV